jgi:hypothetical protein
MGKLVLDRYFWARESEIGSEADPDADVTPNTLN